MSESGYTEGLFLIYFIYGLSFLTMGLTMVLETMRSPSLVDARLLRPLAVFGILHGIHEWLEFFILQSTSVGAIIPDQVAWVRLNLLALSFIALLYYGIDTFRLTDGKTMTWMQLCLAVITVYILIIIVSAITTYAGETTIPWFKLSDAMVRYLLAVPGAILAALGLRYQAILIDDTGNKSLVVSLNWAALAFGMYGISQIFVPVLSMFPANLINSDSFLRTTGIPHQFIRSLLAVVITLNLIRASQILEHGRQEEVLAAQRDRLEALEQIRVELIKRETMRRELLRHTVRVQEDERARIARELHDESAQVLSAFSLDLGTLRNLLSNRKEIVSIITRLQELSHQLSQKLYRLVHDLRPAHLDDLGLVPALQLIIEEDFSPKNLKISIDIDGTQHRLDKLIETVLFRVAQESLTNVFRHANAIDAKLELLYETNRITLRITDAGKGFDPDEVFFPPRGWGLAGMRERVESVNGQFNIRSFPGYGTTVEAIIPLINSSLISQEQ